jgi:PAS domain S-box-containing protein
VSSRPRISLSIAQKVSLLSLLLIVLTSGIVALVLVNKSTEVLTDRALNEIHQVIENQGAELIGYVQEMADDVQIIAQSTALHKVIQAENEKVTDEKFEQYRQALERDLLALIGIKKNYLHVRYIDAKGDEIVRVDRKQHGSPVYAIPTSELQHKGHRDYVKDTLALAPGETYVSDIELYKEHGKIVEPHQVGSRVAMPVFNTVDGKLAGMVIINYEVGYQLKSIQQLLSKRNQEIFITNSQGDYLLHPDSSKQFGFMLGNRFRIQDDLPQLASLIMADEPWDFHRVKAENDGETYIYVFNSLSIDPSVADHHLIVGVRESYDAIIAEQASALMGTYVWVLLVVLLGGFVSLIFARRLLSPLQQMSVILDKYTHGEENDLDLPTKRTDELGVLARSFGSMISRVARGKRKLEELNIHLEERVEERTQALKDSESLHHAILRSMSDAVLTTSFSGDIKGVNQTAADMFGYEEKDMLGKQLSEFVEELDEERFIDANSYRHGCRANGEKFPAEVVVSEGEFSGDLIYTAIIRDVTERLEGDKLKTEFVSTVSHELRTPLTAIKGSLELMNGGALGGMPSQAKPILGIACSNANRLLHIINDLLDMQKIADGKMDYYFDALEVAPFLQQAIEDNQSYADLYKVKFEIKRNVAAGVNIHADVNRLMQVMSNLMSNAAKFSPEGSSVELSAEQEDACVRISVTDHGNGIPEDFYSRIFSKFSQADSSDTRQKGGSGLGLVISRSIVEGHRGHIEFESEEGAGTTFHFCIPMYQDDTVIAEF